jgi:hypothetical protein
MTEGDRQREKCESKKCSLLLVKQLGRYLRQVVQPALSQCNVDGINDVHRAGADAEREIGVRGFHPVAPEVVPESKLTKGVIDIGERQKARGREYTADKRERERERVKKSLRGGRELN